MTTLHLVRLPIDAEQLYRFARQARLPAREIDDGYAVHSLLSGLFGRGEGSDRAIGPKPFAFDPALEGEPRRHFTIFGYAPLDAAALIAHAKRFGAPTALDACDISRIESKPMPAFEVGMRLGYVVRACCVRRVAKRGNQRKDRAEVDAFLARVWEINDPAIPVDRESTYREWLERELRQGGGIRSIAVRLRSHRLSRLHRKTQGDQREGRRLQHPDVTFEGTIEVTDAEVFRSRLARGIGRHRAFGFGMMLLTRAEG